MVRTPQETETEYPVLITAGLDILKNWTIVLKKKRGGEGLGYKISQKEEDGEKWSKPKVFFGPGNNNGPRFSSNR